MELLFKVGFLEVRLLDILDILLVGLLLYYIFKLLRGSLAFNIFLGLLLVFLVWLVVKALDMHLIGGILGQFIGVGVIALLIVFQPEIRRFLLYIGKGSMLKRGGFWRKFFSNKWLLSSDTDTMINEVLQSVEYFSRSQTGTLIIFAKTSRLQFFANTGVAINGSVSAKLFESIFTKTSPLHDGAVIIADNKVLAANCILPVSENPDLPSRVGLRHRAAVGITEHSDAIAVIVSEENGGIAYARSGKLNLKITVNELGKVLNRALVEI